MGMVLAMKQSVDHPNNRLDMNMNLFVHGYVWVIQYLDSQNGCAEILNCFLHSNYKQYSLDMFVAIMQAAAHPKSYWILIGSFLFLMPW